MLNGKWTSAFSQNWVQAPVLLTNEQSMTLLKPSSAGSHHLLSVLMSSGLWWMPVLADKQRVSGASDFILKVHLHLPVSLSFWICSFVCVVKFWSCSELPVPGSQLNAPWKLWKARHFPNTVTSRILQRSIWGPSLFNVFINDWDTGLERILRSPMTQN